MNVDAPIWVLVHTMLAHLATCRAAVLASRQVVVQHVDVGPAGLLAFEPIRPGARCGRRQRLRRLATCNGTTESASWQNLQTTSSSSYEIITRHGRVVRDQWAPARDPISLGGTPLPVDDVCGEPLLGFRMD